jgi:cytochrome c oxidase subunit 2
MGFKNLITSKKILSLLAVFMLFGTSMLFAQGTETAPAADAVKDNGLATAGYYILLFLIVCFIVGIVGKILRVFDLTQQIQGKNPINWNNIMGVCCLIFLVAGALRCLLGVYSTRRYDIAGRSIRAWC